MDNVLQRMAAKKSVGLGLLFILAMALVFCLASPAGVDAKCYVKTGPTDIFEGTALGANDFTVYNDKIAFSMSVDTKNYWSMTNGSILDIALVNEDGSFGAKLVNDVEFLNDLWTSTGTYPGDGKDLREDVKVEITKKSEEKVVVTAYTRYWVADADKDGQDDKDQYGKLQQPLNVTITYTLEDGANYIGLTCKVENPADNKVIYKTMYSGFSITTRAASMFGPYGYYPDVKVTGIRIGAAEGVDEYFGNFVATYDTDYAVTLTVDGADAYKGSTGYKDLYKLQDLEPGKTYDFVGEVLVSGESETASLMDRYIARYDGLTEDDCATISGQVLGTNGKPVSGAYVIAEKTGVYKSTQGEVIGNMQPFLWDITDENGNYSFALPKTGFVDGTKNVEGNGDYKYKFKVEAAGYTSVTSEIMSLTENTEGQNFILEDGAAVKLRAVNENGFMIPFKVIIDGVTSEMKTLGGTTYFSDALDDEDPYTVSFTMTKGEDITFTASYGVDYESVADSYTTDVTDEGVEYTFNIPTKINPQGEGWYCADNHQHSDYGDGGTTIENLFRAQIAAKLDFTVVTDHDTRIHNAEMAAFSEKLGIPFLSNSEISPGWGHWGVLGVNYDSGEALLDSGTATPQDIIAAGHENGAVVIVHHPYSDYGFLNNQASVNGGFEEGWDDFDLLEIQSTVNQVDMEKVANALTDEAWNTIDLNDLNTTLNKVGINKEICIGSCTESLDAKAFVTAMAFWNEGIPKYFSAGSDQHDAASATLYPGIIRMYANLGDDYSVENYLNTLLEGDAYVTMGPILIPDENSEFGGTRYAKDGDEILFTLDAQAVNGLSSVTLWSNGKAVDTVDLENSTDRETVTLKGTVDADLDNVWFSFTAVDADNNHAITNPVWVEVVDGFTDVAGTAWYANAVNAGQYYGVFSGFGDGTFHPEESTTRAEFAWMVYELIGDKNESAPDAGFTDVKDGFWAEAAINYLADEGIIQGYGDGTFKPNNRITRAEIAQILYKALGLDEYVKHFEDVKAGAWYYDAVTALATVGIVNGYPDGTFQPNANALRSESAQIIYNLMTMEE